MAPIRDFPDLRAGGQLSAREFNRLQEELQRLTRIQVAVPLTIDYGPGGPLIRLRPDLAFWAELTTKGGGGGTNAWGWKGKTPASGQTAGGVAAFTDTTNGRTGTPSVNPAYEVGQSPSAKVGDIVWLVPGIYDNSDTTTAQQFLFTKGGGISAPVAGNSVLVVTNVTCVNGQVIPTFKQLSGYVTTNGLNYPVTFTLT